MSIEECERSSVIDEEGLPIEKAVLRRMYKVSMERIADLESSLASARAELADLKFKMECANTPLMADVLRERDELKRQLEAKGKWQTGKPPKDGWYWTRVPFGIEGKMCIPYMIQVVLESNQYSGSYFWLCRQWSGPIEPPEDK